MYIGTSPLGDYFDTNYSLSQVTHGGESLTSKSIGAKATPQLLVARAQRTTFQANATINRYLLRFFTSESY